MSVTRLTARHEPALEELLLCAPATNLFLLNQLTSLGPAEQPWYGVLEGERVVACAAVIPNRLLVPYAPHPEHAAHIGAALRWRHRPCMVVGPRAASDALWSAWAPTTQHDRWYDQRLYVCDAPQTGPALEGFRRANPSDLEQVLVNADAMESEDLGRSPLADDPAGFREVVLKRITTGRTWVVARGGRVLFQVTLGVSTSFGTSLGGTFVPAEARGQGLARAAMAELSRRVLPRLTRLVLHVNEANTPAVRTYEGAGYRKDAPFRLITVPR